MKIKNYYLLFCILILISACDNPGGISDEFYEEYKTLGAPKILYSCSTYQTKRLADFHGGGIENSSELFKYSPDELNEFIEVDRSIGYVAGTGINSTYNSLLQDLQGDCNAEKVSRILGTEYKKLTILDSKQ